MHILVTGGAGFIGSHFIEHMLSTYPEAHVTNLDALTYAGFLHTHHALHTAYGDRYRFVHDRVGNAQTLQHLIPTVDYIVHLAAESNVDLSLESSQVFLHTNILETQLLLEACRQHPRLKRLVLVSTDEVYGNPWQDIPSQENDPLLPCSPYAASKAGQDLLAYSYFVSFGLPVVRSRCVNNYGQRQDPTKLIPRFTLNALKNNPLPLYGSGHNLREWIHAKDHAAALAFLMLGPDSLNGDVFNVGTGIEHSAREVGKAILKHFERPDSDLETVDDRPGHVLRHAVNCEKLKSLGWKPRIDWETGFKETLDWYQQHPQWIQAAVQQQYEKIPHYERYGLSDWR